LPDGVPSKTSSKCEENLFRGDGIGKKFKTQRKNKKGFVQKKQNKKKQKQKTNKLIIKNLNK